MSNSVCQIQISAPSLLPGSITTNVRMPTWVKGVVHDFDNGFCWPRGKNIEIKTLNSPVKPSLFQHHCCSDGPCQWHQVYRSGDDAANHWPQHIWHMTAGATDWLQDHCDVIGGEHQSIGRARTAVASIFFTPPDQRTLFLNHGQPLKGSASLKPRHYD